MGDCAFQTPGLHARQGSIAHGCSRHCELGALHWHEASCIAGDPAGRPLGGDGSPIDIPQGEEVTLAELEAIAQAHSKATAGNAQGNGTAN